LHVEKVMQAKVIYPENFTNEKIKLLQLTAGKVSEYLSLSRDAYMQFSLEQNHMHFITYTK
jgi:predicted transcriptional regulator